ncbi:sensor histidine kinase [Nakamurella sp.]|uniref:sensor histidine kinase n=1 Tax=Nakamurella sp. TaxID=1869182 RepID=UPI003B3B4DD9
MTRHPGAPSRLRSVGRPPPWSDIGLATVLFVVDTLVFSSITVVSQGGVPALLLSIGVFAPLAWRTIAPVRVFFVVWFFTVSAALVVPELRPVLALLVATYTMSSRTDLRTSLLAPALAVPTGGVIAVSAELDQNPEMQAWTIAVSVGVLVGLLNLAPWLLGRWVYASRSAVAALELARQREAEQARVEERRQIALELHDIISHSVTVMVRQADGARAVLGGDPAAVANSLELIAKVGRDSIGELRRLLGVLTDGTLAPVASEAAGLADLTTVIDDAERDGLRVRLQVSGRQPPVPDSFERTVFRIVKEGLVNARKHGGHGNRVTVQMFWSDSVLVLTIADTGGQPDSDASLSTGNGLNGLRERVRASNGRLDAGPGPDGGFAVTATLPIPPTATPVTTAGGSQP